MQKVPGFFTSIIDPARYKNIDSAFVVMHANVEFGNFLSALTQVSFVFAITANNLMIVWPILNATGFLGAVFAYLFLGEKLKRIDFFYIFSAFLITGLVAISFNYEEF